MNTTWDLTALLPDASPEAIAKIQQQSEVLFSDFATKWSKDSSYLSSPIKLLESLQDYENILKTDPAQPLLLFFYLSKSLNKGDASISGHLNKLISWATIQANKIQFYNLSLGKIKPKKQKEFLSDQTLSYYHKHLDQVFKQAKYKLSDAEEKIINLTTPYATNKWVGLVSRLVSESQIDGRNFNTILSEIDNISKPIRDKAARDLVTIFDTYKIVAETEINTIYNYKKEIDKLRKFTRPDTERHLDDDIEPEVIDALRQAVVSKFSLSQKYYELKAKLFKQSKLSYHERNVPYKTIEKKYNYEDGLNLVRQAFSTLDPEYVQILDSYSNNGQIDVYPKIGKDINAYNQPGFFNTSGFVLLTFTEKFDDIMTLAHEMGHAINSVLCKENNRPIYFGTSMATTETASTFFENYTLEYISKQIDDEAKLALNMDRLNSDISSIFRQIACYEFEYDLRSQIGKAGYLSHQEIGQIFQKHMAAYMGPSVSQDPGSELYWIYWPHIRRIFYVYSYAFGLLTSKLLHRLIKQDPSNRKKLKQFLSKDLSLSPSQIFQEIGLNVLQPSFWQQGLQEVEDLLNETVRLATKLKKI